MRKTSLTDPTVSLVRRRIAMVLGDLGISVWSDDVVPSIDFIGAVYQEKRRLSIAGDHETEAAIWQKSVIHAIRNLISE